MCPVNSAEHAAQMRPTEVGVGLQAREHALASRELLEVLLTYVLKHMSWVTYVLKHMSWVTYVPKHMSWVKYVLNAHVMGKIYTETHVMGYMGTKTHVHDGLKMY